MHLNPFYKDHQRLVGKNVIVVDDCTTYGVSFGVASALLRAGSNKSLRIRAQTEPRRLMSAFLIGSIALASD